MLPDFNRLKVFYYVFTRKSIVAAAKDLHITQPGISQHLQKLEAEVQAPLFTRLHKRLVPTAAGERLYAIVQPFMAELAAGVRTIHQSREKPLGLLRVGAPVEFGKAYFPGIFASFRKKHPEVTFFLKLGNPVTLLPMISEGELDLAFVDMFSTQGQFFGDLGAFSIAPVIEEEVILACSRKYYDTEIRGDHSFGNLVTKDFIAYHPHAQTVKSWFRHHFRKSQLHLNIVMTVDSHQAVVAGIRHHMGMGVVASNLAWQEISRGKIVPISTPKKEVLNRISLVQLQDKVPSLTEKTFQGHFREEILQTDVLKKISRGYRK